MRGYWLPAKKKPEKKPEEILLGLTAFAYAVPPLAPSPVRRPLEVIVYNATWRAIPCS